MASLLFLTDDNDIERFNSKCKVLENGCIVWTAAKCPRGYGFFGIRWNNRRLLVRTHRWSWVHRNKTYIPEGYCVMHMCDNPSCVNVDHLKIGTAADNAADRDSKNRQAKGEKISSIVTEEIVLQIRQSDLTNRQLSELLNLKIQTIDGIRKGTRWKHVPMFKKININKYTKITEELFSEMKRLRLQKLTNGQIAEQLGCSKTTVQKHLKGFS